MSTEPERHDATPLERAEREADLEGAARLKYGTLPELERALATANDELAEHQSVRRMLKEEVDEVQHVIWLPNSR